MSIPNAFNAAVRPQFPDIKTRAELDMLQNRPPPQPSLHLTPAGTITAQVNTMVNDRTQERIAQLRQSLDDAHSSLDKGFGAERWAGKASADFGQAQEV